MPTVTLPWPPASLSPNGSHGHFHAHRRAASKYRGECLILLRGQRVPRLYVDGPIMLELTFCPPTKRLSDLDNLLARTKHGIDALAELLGVDDKIFEFTLRRGEPVKGGAILAGIVPECQMYGRAMGLARVQHFLDAFDPDKREEWIADFEQGHTVDEDEAVLLREHNADDEPWYG